VKYDPRTIADAAKIFWAAGESYMMPSEGWDQTNFGLFSGDDALGGAVARRVYEKAQELNARKVVISECGHGYRSTRCEGPNWAAYDIPFEMESSVITMLRYIQEGRIQVDPTKNAESYTFHDSCNNARSCGLTEEPRELLNHVVGDFREMHPNRAENYCCTGGGGAMSMSEYTPRRLKSARIKADQLEATGAKVVVTSCHNCVDGLTDLIRHYKLDMKVTQLGGPGHREASGGGGRGASVGVPDPGGRRRGRRQAVHLGSAGGPGGHGPAGRGRGCRPGGGPAREAPPRHPGPLHAGQGRG
jgi:Fe-S oxidoreductase